MTCTSFTLDPAQRQIQDSLAHLSHRLQANQAVARGAYIWGPVGRGKTMLMNQFYADLQISAKTRIHYHHFMAKVHAALQDYSGKADPLRYVAADWASRYRLLCIDEFMVEDIADAMLLGTLWRHLFDLDVVLVTTSNTPPHKLYANGLQRQRFLPTIDLLQNNCDVLQLDDGRDYRLQANSSMPFYLQNHDEAALRAAAEEYAGAVQASDPIRIMGRNLQPLWKNARAIGFEFAELCSGPRSQRDYMELAATYDTIVVANVPQFSYIPDKDLVHGVEESYQREQQELHVSKLDNEARRFIALVDECYDQNCLVIMSANVAPHELYQARQLATAFQRCASRLFEMQRW
ncbi:cell division protein ZapE [Aliidiomarina sp. Khilg15.8]